MVIDVNIRQATKEDAPSLARLFNMAGSGMPLTYWTQLAQRSDPWKTGEAVVRAKSGEFSYLNCHVAVDDEGSVAGGLNTFKMEPAMDNDEGPEWPPFAIPLQQMERSCAGNWYVNFLATFEQYQGQGIATRLLQEVDRQAGQAAVQTINLIVLGSKASAIGLYEASGYAIIQRKEAIAMGSHFVGDHWCLMEKRL